MLFNGARGTARFLHKLPLTRSCADALVKALLTSDHMFRILMCQSLLHYKSPDALKQVVDTYDEDLHFPSSLWLEKTA